MTKNSYWLSWRFDGDKFSLVDWGSDDLSEKASRAFWPSISIEEAQGTVLLEAFEQQRKIEKEINTQNLPNLDLSKLPFHNTFIIAEPQDDKNIVECTYFID